MKKKTGILFALVCMIMLLGVLACGKKKEEIPPIEQGMGEFLPSTDVDGEPMPEPPPMDMEGGAENNEEPEPYYGWSEEMESLRTAVIGALGSDYWPEASIPSDYLEMLYGVSSDMYEDYMGEMPLMSTKVDTLLIVKAVDGQAGAVENALANYRDGLVADTNQYPMNLGKIQASKVERIGNYVCFVLLGGDTTGVEEDGDEAVIKHCQEQNDLAIQAIAASIQQ